jgi:predicted dehydrogenase
MNSAQAHRGPDDSGTFEDAAAGVALGHVCLSILDLSPAAAQPMHSSHQAERLLENPDVRVVYIASNHASHTPYALSALNAGKTVYIEKPICVDWQQFAQIFLGWLSPPVSLD